MHLYKDDMCTDKLLNSRGANILNIYDSVMTRKRMIKNSNKNKSAR